VLLVYIVIDFEGILVFDTEVPIKWPCAAVFFSC